MVDLCTDDSTYSCFLINPISGLFFYLNFIYISIYLSVNLFTCLSLYSSLSFYLYICVLQSHVYTYHLPCASTLSPYSAPPTYQTSRWAYTLVGAADYWFRCWEWCSGSIHLSKLQGGAQVKNVKGMQGLQEIWETVYLSIYLAIS